MAMLAQIFSKIGVLKDFAIFSEIEVKNSHEKIHVGRDSNTDIFCEFCEIFKNSFFIDDV